MAVPETRMLLLGAVAMFQPVNGSREVLGCLVTRRVPLEPEVAEFVRGKDDPANGPPHARRGWLVWLDLASEAHLAAPGDRGDPVRRPPLQSRRGLGLAAAGRRPRPADDVGPGEISRASGR